MDKNIQTKLSLFTAKKKTLMDQISRKRDQISNIQDDISNIEKQIMVIDDNSNKLKSQYSNDDDTSAIDDVNNKRLDVDEDVDASISTSSLDGASNGDWKVYTKLPLTSRQSSTSKVFKYIDSYDKRK